MESLSTVDRLERIASQYDRRATLSRSIPVLRIPCPAHNGSDDNLALWVDQGKDRIAAKCHSRDCSYADVAKAIEADTSIQLGPPRDVQRTFRYSDGRQVYRTDYATGGKDIKQDRGATADGAPLYIVQPDNPPADPRVIVVEGESTALYLGRLGYWAATWRGGSQAAGKSDHSALVGRAVLLWPDDDDAGRDAMSRIATALSGSVIRTQYAGLSSFTGNSKMDAADYEPDDVAAIIAGAIDDCPWESTPYIMPLFPGLQLSYDYQIVPYSELIKLPSPVAVVPGLLYEKGITLLYGRPGVGKSTLSGALNAAAAPGGPPFCGQYLEPTPILTFTEEPKDLFGERMRRMGIGDDSGHMVNLAAALSLHAEQFAENVYQEFHRHGAGFGIIVVDTISSFLLIKDFNDYSEVSNAFDPLRQLAAALPNTSLLLFHHANKGFGDILGSTAIPAKTDVQVALKREGTKLEIKVSGRYRTDPFPMEEFTTIALTESGEAMMLGTDGQQMADIVFKYLGNEPVSIKDLATEMQSAEGWEDDKRKAVSDAIRTLVREGRAVQVQAHAGTRPATYRAS